MNFHVFNFQFKSIIIFLFSNHSIFKFLYINFLKCIYNFK